MRTCNLAEKVFSARAEQTHNHSSRKFQATISYESSSTDKTGEVGSSIFNDVEDDLEKLVKQNNLW